MIHLITDRCWSSQKLGACLLKVLLKHQSFLYYRLVEETLDPASYTVFILKFPSLVWEKLRQHWSFDKILDIINKLVFALSYKYVIFPYFWLTLTNLFCLNYVKPFLPTVNKCTIIKYNLVLTKEKAQKGHLCSGATKINLKNLKT